MENLEKQITDLVTSTIVNAQLEGSHEVKFTVSIKVESIKGGKND